METKIQRSASVKKSVAIARFWRCTLCYKSSGGYISPYTWIVHTPGDVLTETSRELAKLTIIRDGLLPVDYTDGNGNLRPRYQLQVEIMEWEGASHNVARLF